MASPFICAKIGGTFRERDVWRLRESMKTRLNLEMACTTAMIAFALKLKPDSVCVVPESRQEITTEGGLDVVSHRVEVGRCIEAMTTAGIATSLFIDPDPKQIAVSAELKTPWVNRVAHWGLTPTTALTAACAGVCAFAGSGFASA